MFLEVILGELPFLFSTLNPNSLHTVLTRRSKDHEPGKDGNRHDQKHATSLYVGLFGGCENPTE